MLKPKNISIKKISQADTQADNKKHRNSRKSLKMPKRDISQSNKPSPIHIMKQDTNADDDSQSDHGNFIACINGYLNKLDSGKLQSKVKSIDECEIETIKRKIKKEKSINRNMQKNIMEFQRILWERTEKLQRLQEFMRDLQAKQNDRNSTNMSSHVKSRHKISKKTGLQQISSQYENVPSQQSESEFIQENHDRYKRRRKTQMPNQIQRMISRTMALFPQKYNKRKV